MSQGYFLLCLTYQNTNLIKETYSFKISWVVDFSLQNHTEFAKYFQKHTLLLNATYISTQNSPNCTIIRTNIYDVLSIAESEWVLKVKNPFQNEKENLAGVEDDWRPYSHQNELESFHSSLLIRIATGFTLFNSLDSKFFYTFLFSTSLWLITFWVSFQK